MDQLKPTDVLILFNQVNFMLDNINQRLNNIEMWISQQNYDRNKKIFKLNPNEYPPLNKYPPGFDRESGSVRCSRKYPCLREGCSNHQPCRKELNN